MNSVVFTDEQMIQEDDFDGYHFINISSVKTGNYQYGELDFLQLSKCHTPSNTIVLVHHALVSSDDKDNAVIRNGYAIQKFLEDHSIITLLHGHTHGSKRYTVGNDCQVIGVGPMFKPIDDVSNQCNLIHISGSKVNEIITLTYQGDREEWDGIQTYERYENNNYYGSSIYELYEKVLNDAESDSLLPNLRLQVKQTFKKFEEEVNDKFSACLPDAKAWQSFSCPDFLDYTHGELMCTKNINWDDFAIKKLRENPTNKRTIIPLITKEASFASEDAKLVSFDVVQFGFLDSSMKDLYVTIYMRALEVRHFLPINICEAYLMAKKIKEQIQTIDNVTICFFVFRAEQKLEYGCYRKADIDLLSESELCQILSEKKYTEIAKLLLQKAKMSDTVIENGWLNNLKNAFKTFYKEENRPDVLGKIDEIESFLNTLREVRLHCSDYSKTQEQEDEFTTALYELIELLQ